VDERGCVFKMDRGESERKIEIVCVCVCVSSERACTEMKESVCLRESVCVYFKCVMVPICMKECLKWTERERVDGCI